MSYHISRKSTKADLVDRDQSPFAQYFPNRATGEAYIIENYGDRVVALSTSYA